MSQSEKNVRLQKFLSDAGVASRRHAEELITDGKVAVNGLPVTDLPAFVDPRDDAVEVNGIRVKPQQHEYFILHKPPGVVCTMSDPGRRPRAIDLLPRMKVRVVPVGRLDMDTSGLLLMTNDGELAQKLTHPKYGVSKLYRAEVRGWVPDDLPDKMRKGIYLSDGKATASEVHVAHRSRQRSILHITLREGRNRQVRRMLARLGHPVRKLKRLAFGPLSVKRLQVGAVRRLTPRELASLRKEAEQGSPPEAQRHASGKQRRKRPQKPGSGRGKPRSMPSTGRKGTARPQKRRLIT